MAANTKSATDTNASGLMGWVTGLSTAAANVIGAIKGGSSGTDRQLSASQSQQMPAWVVPVGIGAGVLVLLAVLVSVFRK